MATSSKHARSVRAREAVLAALDAELANRQTIYGPQYLVNRYNAMIARTPQVARRLAERYGAAKLIKLSGFAGWNAASLHNGWGDLFAIAGDDPRIGFYESLERQLAAAAKRAR